MSLRCCIPGKHTKIFARCVQCINKLTEEFVYIQIYPDGLIFKCVNIACSAFANFAFGVSFFLYYECPDFEKSEENSLGDYKLSARALVHIFSRIDKTVDACTIELDPRKGIIFTLQCKHGIIKQYKLPIIDFEVLKTFCKVDCLSNYISSNSKLISSAFNIFPKNDEEINMVLTKDTFIFRNYDGGINNLNSSIHTQSSLDKIEFFTFDIQKETALIFCCREFRSILSLSSHLCQDLDISFDSPSQPILIKLKSDKNYDITFIISTTSDTFDNKDSNSSIASTLDDELTSLVNSPPVVESSNYKQRSFNFPLFDFDSDIPVDSTIGSTNQDILQIPIQSQRFREGILADMREDYCNNYGETATMVASVSDDEEFAL